MLSVCLFVCWIKGLVCAFNLFVCLIWGTFTVRIITIGNKGLYEPNRSLFLRQQTKSIDPSQRLQKQDTDYLLQNWIFFLADLIFAFGR